LILVVRPSLEARNIVAALLTIAGLGLLAAAALDWAAYTGFSISLLWR
jgi:hypothetical protein